MFLFISIDPTINEVADEKRIFRINLKKIATGFKEWIAVERELNELLSDDNCRAIRALTWRRLPEIIDEARRLTPIIQEIKKKDNRSSHAEALLYAAYFLIWKGWEKIDETEARAILSDVIQRDEEEPNETVDMVERILDEIIFLPEAKKSKTIREMLNVVLQDDITEPLSECRDMCERYGVRIYHGNLAIANNNKYIAKILNINDGYNKQLRRHPGFVEILKPTRFAGGTKRGIVIKGVLDGGKE
jgi:hypothetical protein